MTPPSRVALVTGTSGGIGTATLPELARRGSNVIVHHPRVHDALMPGAITMASAAER